MDTPHNYSDIAFDIGNINLPCYGFRNPEYHLMVTTPDITSRLTEYVTTRFGLLGMHTITKLIASTSREAANVVLNNSPISDSLHELISGLAFTVYPIYKLKQTLSLQNYLCSFLFFGLQPKRFKGFTFYKNKILNSDQGSFMHYALSPFEYIGYGLPVHAVKDGEVVEVVNNVRDSVRGYSSMSFELGDNVIDSVGNFVRIKHSAIVDTIYGSLMQYSTTVRVGDKVRKGQIIGKMGCSAEWSNIPFLYFQIAYTGPKLPVFGLSHLGFLPSMLTWDPFMYCDILKLPMFGGEDDRTNSNTITNIDARRLPYQYALKKITDFTLVKKFPVILAE